MSETVILQNLIDKYEKRIAELEQENERLRELLEQASADAVEGGSLFEKKQLGDIRYREGMERAAEIADQLHNSIEFINEMTCTNEDAAKAIRAEIEK